MKKIVFVCLIFVLTEAAYSGNEPKLKKVKSEQVSEVGRFPANEPNYPKYVEECRKPAVTKLNAIAQINGFELDENTVSVHSVDDRWYNPSKYVWFQAIVKKADGTSDVIQTLTQKSFVPLKDCF